MSVLMMEKLIVAPQCFWSWLRCVLLWLADLNRQATS